MAACGESEELTEQATTAATIPVSFGQCRACHSLEPGVNGIGPSLAGMFGKSAAQEPSFAYSPAMRESGLVWDSATLDAYLRNPRASVLGTKMSYPGLRDDAARAELVEWLKGV